MDRYFAPIKDPSLSPEEGAKPLTMGDMQAHQKRLEQNARIRSFQEDLRGLPTKPVIFGEGDSSVTHVFDSEQAVHEFAESVRRGLSEGFSAQQLLMLHKGPALINQAYEKGRRDAQVHLERQRAGVQVQNSGQGNNTPAPERAAEAPTERQGRKGMSIQDRLAKIDPRYYDSFMKGEVDISDRG